LRRSFGSRRKCPWLRIPQGETAELCDTPLVAGTRNQDGGYFVARCRALPGGWGVESPGDGSQPAGSVETIAKAIDFISKDWAAVPATGSHQRRKEIASEFEAGLTFTRQKRASLRCGPNYHRYYLAEKCAFGIERAGLVFRRSDRKPTDLAAPRTKPYARSLCCRITSSFAPARSAASSPTPVSALRQFMILIGRYANAIRPAGAREKCIQPFPVSAFFHFILFLFIRTGFLPTAAVSCETAMEFSPTPWTARPRGVLQAVGNNTASPTPRGSPWVRVGSCVPLLDMLDSLRSNRFALFMFF